jgi:hypothetical protein
MKEYSTLRAPQFGLHGSHPRESLSKQPDNKMTDRAPHRTDPEIRPYRPIFFYPRDLRLPETPKHVVQAATVTKAAIPVTIRRRRTIPSV